MVEKTLIVIISIVFVLSSWWWSHRQDNTEKFYEEQLRQRDIVARQLSTLALPRVKDKTPAQVRDLFQNLYPQNKTYNDQGMLFSGNLGVLFSKGDLATDFFLPGDDFKAAQSR